MSPVGVRYADRVPSTCELLVILAKGGCVVDETEGAEAGDAAKRKRFEDRWIRLAVVVTLAVVLAAFILDNSQRVDVGFLVTERATPLYLVLLVTAVLGAVVDRLFTSWRRR